MDELKEVLETISSDPLEDLSEYPAALVVYTPDGPRVWLNNWQQLTPRLLDQFKVHAVAEREASRRKLIKTEKEVSK
jgi:hypothetical protein